MGSNYSYLDIESQILCIIETEIGGQGGIMDIQQLKYFISVVENDFNLSDTAEKLNITQSGLSKYIRNFEESENVSLFVRSKGRFIALTAAGTILYGRALALVSIYEAMMQELGEHTQSISGSIRIGIPPIAVTLLFPEILNTMITDHPNIEFSVLEHNASRLKKMLTNQEVDLTLTLHPSRLDPDQYDETIIFEDELVAFMDSNHCLAQKKRLKWSDFDQQKLTFFDKSFLAHDLLLDRFKTYKTTPNIVMTSSLWDFLLNAIRSTEMITILPSLTQKRFQFADISMVPIADPLPWRIVLSRVKKKRYSRVERLTHDIIIAAFARHYSDYQPK